MRRSLLVLAAVFLSFSGCDRVDCSYATLADARKDRVFKRGWLLDILPASTRQIRVINDVDTNHSEGEFWFDPADFSACGLTLMAKIHSFQTTLAIISGG